MIQVAGASHRAQDNNARSLEWGGEIEQHDIEGPGGCHGLDTRRVTA